MAQRSWKSAHLRKHGRPHTSQGDDLPARESRQTAAFVRAHYLIDAKIERERQAELLAELRRRYYPQEIPITKIYKLMADRREAVCRCTG
jgi:hypothetical protein